jgi:phage-related protein
LQRRSVYLSLERVEEALENTFPAFTLELGLAYELSSTFRTEERIANAGAFVGALMATPQLSLTLQQVEEILEQAREQTAHLQSFNSNLAIQLGEALDSKLQPLMQHAIDRLEAALRDMGGSIGSTNQDALRSLLASFIDELRGSLRSDSGELQRNLAELAANLGRTSSELTERMASVFSGVEVTGERLSSILNDASIAFRTEMGRAQESAGSGLTEALAAMQTAADYSSRQSEAMLQQLAAGAASFRSSVEGGATAFVGELDRGARSIDVTVERLGGSVSLLATLIDRVSRFGDASARVTSERLTQLHNTLSDLDTGFKRVNDASVPFGRAAEQVRASVELLRVTESSIQARLSEFSAAATAMTSSSTSLSRTVSKDVSRLTESFGSTTDRLTAAISTIAGQSEAASASFAEEIRKTLAEYENRFAAIDQELQNGLRTIVEQFASTYEEIRERVGTIDMQMAESINRLATFNETFAEHTEDLAASVEKLSLSVAGSR